MDTEWVFIDGSYIRARISMQVELGLVKIEQLAPQEVEQQQKYI